uniref:Putative secreted protein n=1 Tax=Anopheles darlingi TaxID=43151 RepID=A0A2M4DBD7_ANODA
MKCFRFLRLSFLLRMRANTRPGVPTMMCGVVDFSTSSSFWIGIPPKNTATLIDGMYLQNRSYSLLIWKASSRVWHITSTYGTLSVGSNC